MNLRVFFKELMIVGSMSVAITLALSLQGFSQDKEEPGKDDENTITLKIVKDDNGNVTVIDTTITTKGGKKGMKYEYVVRDYEKQMEKVDQRMRDLDEDMRQFEVEVMMGDEMNDIDSIVWVGDSIKKHIVIRGGGYPKVMKAPHGEMFFDDGDHFQRFNWTEEHDDFFMPRTPMSPQLESLLQSIPMGNIKGFQIKDRRDGKRIIIDIDDAGPVMIMAPYRHRGAVHRQQPKTIIIEREMDDMQIPPPPPPPPPDAPKENTKPEKG